MDLTKKMAADYSQLKKNTNNPREEEQYAATLEHEALEVAKVCVYSHCPGALCPNLRIISLECSFCPDLSIDGCTEPLQYGQDCCLT